MAVSTNHATRLSPSWWGGWIGLLAIALFFTLVFISGNKPFHLDGIDFVGAAEATARSGVPIYYRGEDGPSTSGLYHPPLYIYVLAGWYRLFSSSPLTTRLLGALCALLQGILALRIFSELWGRETATKVSRFFWPLFLLNPYVLSVSGVPDIDSTIYGPLLLTALWLTVTARWKNGSPRKNTVGWRHWALLSLSLTVAVWAKITTVLLLGPFLAVFLWERRRPFRSLGTTAGIVVGAGLGFVISYRLFGALFHLDTGYTYDFLRLSLRPRHGGGLSDRLGTFLYNVGFNLRWEGMLFWITVDAAFLLLAVRAVKHRAMRDWHSLLLLGVALTTVGYYWTKLLPFGDCPSKYGYVFWSILVLPIAALGAGATFSTEPLTRRAFTLGGLVALLGAETGFWFLGDHLFPGAPHPLSMTALLGVSAIALFIAVLGATTERSTAAKYGMLWWLLVLAQGSTYAGMAVAMARAPYTTDYDYGQMGIEATADFLETHTQPDEIICSMKDVGVLAHRRYFENFSAVAYGGNAADRLIEQLRTRQIRFAVFTTRHGGDHLSTDLKEKLNGVARLAATFDDYVIYEPLPPAK